MSIEEILKQTVKLIEETNEDEKLDLKASKFDRFLIEIRACGNEAGMVPESSVKNDNNPIGWISYIPPKDNPEDVNEITKNQNTEISTQLFD